MGVLVPLIWSWNRLGFGKFPLKGSAAHICFSYRHSFGAKKKGAAYPCKCVGKTIPGNTSGQLSGTKPTHSLSRVLHNEPGIFISVPSCLP